MTTFLQEKIMTRIEARKTIRKHALTQYNATVVLVLQKLLDSTFRKDTDNIEARIEMPAKRLMQSAGVQRRQLRRILEQLSDASILLDMECGKDVCCYLNLEPLTKLATFVDVQKADIKARNAARTKAARDKRMERRNAIAHEREIRQVANFVKVHFELLEHANEARASYSL
jgi:hypothetical protein